MQFLSPILLLRFSNPGAQVADSRGYLYTAIIYSIVSIPMFLIVFFTSKEVVQPSAEQEKFSVSATIKNLVQNKIDGRSIRPISCKSGSALRAKIVLCLLHTCR